jgi:hypothetical protein
LSSRQRHNERGEKEGTPPSPVTQVKTVETYSFAELSGKAKEIARQTIAEFETGYDWYQPDMDYYRDELQTRGYEAIAIMFTGFGSQGDGAYFTATVAIQQWLKSHKLAHTYRALYHHADAATIVLRHAGRYYHKYSVSAQTACTGDDKVCEQAEAVAALAEQEMREVSDDIYASLENEYDYRMSEENILEVCAINDYSFFNDGALFHY